jgi:putative membrane protein
MNDHDPSSAPSKPSTRPAIAAILAISAAATLFLFWLIYVHPAAARAACSYAFLPALNALLNGLSATALLIGYTFIRARRIKAIARP